MGDENEQRVFQIAGRYPDLSLVDPTEGPGGRRSQRDRTRTSKGQAFEMDQAVKSEVSTHKLWRQAVVDLREVRNKQFGFPLYPQQILHLRELWAIAEHHCQAHQKACDRLEQCQGQPDEKDQMVSFCQDKRRHLQEEMNELGKWLEEQMPEETPRNVEEQTPDSGSNAEGLA